MYKKRTIVIAMSIAVLLLITGFSLFSTRLTINGISEVTSSWKVYFESIEKTSVEGAATEASTPKIFNTTIEFEVNLRKPGDSITYTAVLKNGGTIGAIVNNIDASVTATESSTYTVTGIKKGDKLAAGASKTITIKVEYDRDYTAVPDEKTNDLIINIECVQDAGQTVTGEDLIIQKPKVIRANGDIDTVGTDLQIGNEHFYIISSDSTKVVALAKYNLDINTGDTSTTYKGTGKQDSNVSSGTKGAIAYSNNLYWSGYVSGNDAYYTYQVGSNTYDYVEKYKLYLESLGVSIRNARLITNFELESLGCSYDNKICSSTDTSTPAWVYSTTYWSGSSYGASEEMMVVNDGSYDYTMLSSYNAGVRPVIEIDASIFNVKVNGNIDTVGTDIQIGNEHFYVISSDSSKVTALARYNLDVNAGSYIYKGTGKQDFHVLGSKNNSVYGTLVYSTSSYWDSTCTSYPCEVYGSQSSLYTYVSNYKTYLTGLGAKILNARLITYDELQTLGCNAGGSNACSNAPAWVSNTSFWTGTAIRSMYIWMLDGSGYLGNYGYYATANTYGVRPVIEIPRSAFQ